MGAIAGAQELVEHRLGVAHASGREMGDERDGLGVGRLPFLHEDPTELALDLRDRQRPEREALQARHDRRPDLRRIRGAEDEEHIVRRLLERLEKDVPALLDALDLVDDEDLATQVRRRRVDARHELAHVVDRVVGGRVQLDHVERAALPDRRRTTEQASHGSPSTTLRAVDGLGQDARERCLAGPARPDEEEAMSQAVEADGVAQRLDDGLLADDLVEALGAPAAVERLVGGRAGHRPMIRGKCAVHPPSTGTFACPPRRSARTRPVRGTRRSALNAASFRT